MTTPMVLTPEEWESQQETKRCCRVGGLASDLRAEVERIAKGGWPSARICAWLKAATGIEIGETSMRRHIRLHLG